MNAATKPSESVLQQDDLLREREGADKAAAVLLALDRDRASRLLKHLTQSELKLVARAAVKLGPLGTREVTRIFEEFTAGWTCGPDLQGSAEEAMLLFAESLPPGDASEIRAEAAGGPDTSVWTRLSQAPAASVAAMIHRERPNIGAYVLANLDSGFAAAVIAEFPLEKRADMLGLMIASPNIAEPVKRAVETSLKNGFLKNQTGSAGLGVISKVAGIVGTYDAREIEAIVKNIEAAQPREGKQLRKMLFSFEDVDKLSKQALSLLLDKLSTEAVVLALRGTEAGFRDTVLSCLASRARRLVESELNTAATASQADIAKARKSIADTVLQMAARNEIELPSTDDAVMEAPGQRQT